MMTGMLRTGVGGGGWTDESTGLSIGMGAMPYRRGYKIRVVSWIGGSFVGNKVDEKMNRRRDQRKRMPK